MICSKIEVCAIKKKILLSSQQIQNRREKIYESGIENKIKIERSEEISIIKFYQNKSLARQLL